MKSILIAALLLGTAIASKAPNHKDLHSYSFDDYVTAFGKTYANQAEREAREMTFNENLNTIRAHNANPRKTYTMNVNDMADWTAAERKRLNGGIPKAKAGLKAEHLPNMKVAPTVAATALPRSVDWRRAFPPVISAVKDQGNCGSCWAHASTETLETHYAIQTGELFVLSQEEITACAPNPNDCGGQGGCMGSVPELAYEYVINQGGMTEEWQWPYTSFNGTTGVCQAPFANPKNVASFSSYVVLNPNDLDAVMTAVAQAGPLAINVDANPWSFYESGVFSGCSYTENIDINHVVQLVGYGTDSGLGLDYWLVRNSWSASFGEGGYIRLLREKTAVCGTDTKPADGTGCNNGPASVTVCGMCGVLYDTSYPVPVVPGSLSGKKQVKLH